jgi:hypothetical protein
MGVVISRAGNEHEMTTPLAGLRCSFRHIIRLTAQRSSVYEGRGLVFHFQGRASCP